MKARGLAGCMAVAAAVLLALPVSAGATSLVLREKGLHLSTVLPASHGYTAQLRTDGHHQVTLSFFKGEAGVSYTTLGTVSRKGIRADFGRFGEINLRFRGKSGPRPAELVPFSLFPERRCKGRRPVRERGVFAGNIRFEGKNKFTKVVAHRLKGSVTRSYKVVCRIGRDRAAASGARQRPEVVFFGATARSGGVSRFLLVLDLSVPDPDGGTFDLSIDAAGRQEKVGRTAVAAGTFLFAVASAVTVKPRKGDPVSATVKPPPPFSGIGSYQVGEGGAPPSWTGSLGIRLPGDGLVPLTGPEFETVFCRARSAREEDRCDRSLEEFEPLSYGSGSHSQPLALARLSSLKYRWNLLSSLGSTP